MIFACIKGISAVICSRFACPCDLCSLFSIAVIYRLSLLLVTLTYGNCRQPIRRNICVEEIGRDIATYQ